MNEAQRKVDTWIQQHGGYWDRKDIALKISEEYGELIKEFNRLFGPQRKKASGDMAKLTLELGDLLFAIACLANSNSINLDAALEKSIEKYSSPTTDRYE
ncbi:MAG: nucleotide pyrophosphohydrolase [Candidatus Sungbacteria bacterium]|uniref:Nucleotide pyrophosphohydrolase n=1 Tax=Candidatus Sungiibacteriota bacterium TaxID=2750080 RepID=A0A932YYN5_9BACT|nr:nucleotide pyrophosphohydrolase [Candidatus Sungbacteria bacterium]